MEGVKESWMEKFEQHRKITYQFEPLKPLQKIPTFFAA
jgi:hypothetical protein